MLSKQVLDARSGNLDSLKIALPRNKYSNATLYAPRNEQRVHYRLTSNEKSDIGGIVWQFGSLRRSFANRLKKSSGRSLTLPTSPAGTLLRQALESLRRERQAKARNSSWKSRELVRFCTS